MLVYIQPFFAPTRAQADRNLRSLTSLKAYLLRYPSDVGHFIFGGWGEEPFISELVSAACDLFKGSTCKIVRLPRNYGKAYIVNSLIDIVFSGDETPDLLFFG